VTSSKEIVATEKQKEGSTIDPIKEDYISYINIDRSRCDAI